MTAATRLVLVALSLNVIVLAPVVSVLLLDAPAAQRGFGPVTDARLILTSVYMAIGAVSLGLITMHLKRMAWATPMTVALFSVQIIYKLITAAMVGISNPVIITNLVIVVVQAVALFALWTDLKKRVTTT
jgi:hypothetical protein